MLRIVYVCCMDCGGLAAGLAAALKRRQPLP